MNRIAIEIGILLLLTLGNGLFAMVEIAVVASRRSKLRRLAEQGNSRARLALALAESPNRFLATVQVGITLIGILAGVYGGATLAGRLAKPMESIPWLSTYAQEISFVITVLGITYLSLVLGELVPKRWGLSNPEGIAMASAPTMNALATLSAPIVRLLTVSSDALLKLFQFRPAKEASVSAEEVKGLMQEGLRAGAFNRVESDLVQGVLDLDQLRVRDLMTPRTKVIWLNVNDPHDAIWHKIVVSDHSWFPVFEENRDRVIGMVSVKSIYANLAAGVPIKLRDLLVPPLVVPETVNPLQLLEAIRQNRKHIAVVADEFGSLNGVVTLHDVMEAIVGELPSAEERARPEIRKREDGSWLIDGLIEIEKVETSLPGIQFDPPDDREYQTLAGFVVYRLGRVPKEGESFQSQGYTFEVLDMDHHRVDKVLVLPPSPAETAEITGEASKG